MQHLKTIMDILRRTPPLVAVEELFPLKFLSRVSHSHRSQREVLFQIRRSPFTGLNLTLKSK